MKFILSYFFFVFSIVLSYAQKGSLDYYEYNVDYEDLLAGGKSLGPGGYFDARWFIDGTELHQICTEKFELDPDYIDGTGFLAMIGSNGDDFVKRCMYGYVDYYGENKSVFGLSVPCYLFCFSNETVLVCRWNTGGDDINLILDIMSLFYEKAMDVHDIDERVVNYLLYCLSNDLFGDLLEVRGGIRYSRFIPCRNLKRTGIYTEVFVSTLTENAPYTSGIYYDIEKGRYLGRDYDIMLLEDFLDKYQVELPHLCVMSLARKYADYCRSKMNDADSFEYEKDVMLGVIEILSRILP